MLCFILLIKHWHFIEIISLCNTGNEMYFSIEFSVFFEWLPFKGSAD